MSDGTSTAPSSLKGYARKLHQSMNRARATVEELELKGTRLMSIGSYLAIFFTSSYQSEVEQANRIHLETSSNLKPFWDKLDIMTLLTLRKKVQ